MANTIPAVCRKALTDPFVLFLIAAGCIFAAYSVIVGHRQTIVVPVSVQRVLEDDYVLMTGKKPDAKARERLIDDFVNNEVLFREAVERGMHMSDKTTKQRLIDRVRFMISGAPPEPNEDELMAWYASHQDLYRAEPWISLNHIFFEKEPKDSAAILAKLNAGQSVAGDEFWMGHDMAQYGISMLRGIFGEPFLKAMETQSQGTWQGPVRSSRGWHFVKVTERGGSTLLPYPQARDQVKQDLQASQTGAAVNKELVRLKKGYTVDVES